MPTSKNYVVSITIIGVLFFIFGFITWLNGTLIPFLKLSCDLTSDSQALLVTFAFYMAYFFLAIPSSFILGKTGYKRGMSLGLMIMAIGAFLFIPAARDRNFSLFLTGLFIQGMGLALLQTASNPYIAVIGPIESAAKRISIMGVCNKVAGALSPLILGAVVLKGAAEIESQIASATDPAQRILLLQELSHRVINPYLIMGLVLAVLAILIWISPLPEIESASSENGSDGSPSKTSVFEFPHLLLGVLCLFLYVGVEVMAGDVIGTYGKSLGMALDQTKNFTSYTLWSMVLGYAIGIIAIPKYLKQQTALKISAIVGIVFATLAFVTHGYMSILFIALLGLANSLMWPAIFPMAIDGLGKFTKIGSALLVMGIAGGAILPQVYGLLAKSMSTQTAFWICTLPCYLYILYYAMRGHLVGRKTA
ncbi:MAG: sugar MFS transporter [Bacteroidetes bacterium]|nr:sugar MFS transporter [Bacteroidota bacterium]MBS1539645.1 sugar MFS transporter [Bacteroidota bacterium]